MNANNPPNEISSVPALVPENILQPNINLLGFVPIFSATPNWPFIGLNPFFPGYTNFGHLQIVPLLPPQQLATPQIISDAFNENAVNTTERIESPFIDVVNFSDDDEMPLQPLRHNQEEGSALIGQENSVYREAEEQAQSQNDQLLQEEVATFEEPQELRGIIKIDEQGQTKQQPIIEQNPNDRVEGEKEQQLLNQKSEENNISGSSVKHPNGESDVKDIQSDIQRDIGDKKVSEQHVELNNPIPQAPVQPEEDKPDATSPPTKRRLVCDLEKVNEHLKVDNVEKTCITMDAPSRSQSKTKGEISDSQGATIDCTKNETSLEQSAAGLSSEDNSSTSTSIPSMYEEVMPGAILNIPNDFEHGSSGTSKDGSSMPAFSPEPSEALQPASTVQETVPAKKCQNLKIDRKGKQQTQSLLNSLEHSNAGAFTSSTSRTYNASTEPYQMTRSLAELCGFEPEEDDVPYSPTPTPIQKRPFLARAAKSFQRSETKRRRIVKTSNTKKATTPPEVAANGVVENNVDAPQLVYVTSDNVTKLIRAWLDNPEKELCVLDLAKHVQEQDLQENAAAYGPFFELSPFFEWFLKYRVFICSELQKKELHVTVCNAGLLQSKLELIKEKIKGLVERWAAKRETEKKNRSQDKNFVQAVRSAWLASNPDCLAQALRCAKKTLSKPLRHPDMFYGSAETYPDMEKFEDEFRLAECIEFYDSNLLSVNKDVVNKILRHVEKMEGAHKRLLNAMDTQRRKRRH